jgi:hypothetical protein
MGGESLSARVSNERNEDNRVSETGNDLLNFAWIIFSKVCSREG